MQNRSRAQVGQQRPASLAPHAPDDNQRAGLPRLRAKDICHANPAATRSGNQVRWRHRLLAADRTHGDPVVQTQERMQAPPAQVTPQLGAPQTAVDQDKRAPFARDGRGEIVDKGQDVRHPRACCLRWHDAPGDRNGTAAGEHTDHEGNDAVLMGDRVDGERQGRTLLPPPNHLAQQGGKTRGKRNLRRAGPGFVPPIFQPLTQPLSCGVSFEEHDELDHDRGQTGAFGQHGAVHPQRQAQDVRRLQAGQLLRYLLLN